MVDLSALGSTSLGIWRRSDALVLLGRGAVQARVARGEWRAPLRGVLCDGGHDLSAQQWAVAATLASGARAVVCGRDAARVWGLPLIDDDDPATGMAERFLHDVATTGGYARLLMPAVPGAPRGHELRRHRLSLRPEDVVQHEGGFLITSPLRTAVHCASLLSHEAAVCLIDQALRCGLVYLPDLESAVRARRGAAGSRELARAVAAADGRSESALETLGRLLLLPVLPGLVPQVTLRGSRGQVLARFDLADEEARLAFEADGKRGHAGEQMVAKDRRRDRVSEALGWRTERITWWDVRRGQRELIERAAAVHAALARRAA